MFIQHRLRALLVPAALLLPAVAPASTADSFEAMLKGPGGRCLGVDGAPRERAPVVLEACAGTADQAWRLPADGFAGELRQGDLCLDVDRADEADGAALQLFGCHGGANQRWTRTTDGAWAGLAGKCLSLEGAAAVLDTCDRGDRQHFQVDARDRWSWLDAPGRQPVERVVLTSDPEIVYGARVYGYTEQPLLRSADGGRTFGPVTEALFGTAPLLVGERDPNFLFGLSKGDGHLLQSADGGRTWRVVIDERIVRVRASRTHPDRFFATDGFSIWRSVDRGIHFMAITGPAAGEAGAPYSVDLAEAADGSLYVATPHYSGDVQSTHFYRRALGVWQHLPVGFDLQAYNPDERNIVVHPTASGLIYLLLPGVDTAATRLYRSQGDGWLPLSVPVGIIERAYVVPGDAEVLWLAIDGKLWRSADRGQTWRGASPPGSPAVFEGFPAATGLRLLAAVEGPTPRYFESDDGGATWLERSPFGRQRKGVHEIVASKVAGRFYALQSDAIRRTDDGGRTWQTLAALNVDYLRQLVEDPLDPNILYLSTSTYHFSAIHRSRDGGTTFSEHLDGDSLELALVGPGGGRVLLMLNGGSSVHRSTDDGATWTAIEVPQPIYGLVADGGAIYGWGYDRSLRSLDAGLHWEALPQARAPLSAGGGLVAYLRKTNPGSVAEIGVSSDRGSTWRYHPLPAALGYYSESPEIDATGVLYYQDYLGTFFRSQSAGATWEEIGDGLGRNSVIDLAADETEAGRLLAATPEGLFATRLSGERPLSLQSGRFEISLHHRDAEGVERAGHALSLTADSGQFWLFTPERAEVAVKLLDARAIDGRFWAFVASLSNVEFDLEVLDRASGERRRYYNPRGVMASFADTAAFPHGAPEPAAAALPSYESALRAETVTELHGRFEVSVAWRTATGQAGEGQGASVGSESAAFSFFSPENVELMVNVIDGRSLNGKYWVFYAGLTNVEYTITLRDRVTGTIKTYHNPLGSFASVADTSAF